jgi:peptidoglycan hydrolase CwlO-like protein
VITQEDANNALTKIMNDVANADLSLEEADQLMSLIQRKIDSTQLCIREELEILKERVQNRQDNP